MYKCKFLYINFSSFKYKLNFDFYYNIIEIIWFGKIIYRNFKGFLIKKKKKEILRDLVSNFVWNNIFKVF